MEVVRHLRQQLHKHYLSFFKDTHNLFQDKAEFVFSSIPFVLGFAIKQIIAKLVRYGSELLLINDPQLVQLY
jgi:hypothetical protein